MYIMDRCEYNKVLRRYERLFDKVVATTGSYSYTAIREALTPAEVDEFKDLEAALDTYHQQQAFYACLRSGDYRS